MTPLNDPFPNTRQVVNSPSTLISTMFKQRLCSLPPLIHPSLARKKPNPSEARRWSGSLHRTSSHLHPPAPASTRHATREHTPVPRRPMPCRSASHAMMGAKTMEPTRAATPEASETSHGGGDEAPEGPREVRRWKGMMSIQVGIQVQNMEQS